jgi:hypothetical protein
MPIPHWLNHTTVAGGTLRGAPLDREAEAELRLPCPRAARIDMAGIGPLLAPTEACAQSVNTLICLYASMVRRLALCIVFPKQARQNEPRTSETTGGTVGGVPGQ